jgi:hypothetical protein
MLYREIMTVCTEIITKHIHSVDKPCKSLRENFVVRIADTVLEGSCVVNFSTGDEENLQLQYPSEVPAYQLIITKCLPPK